MLNPLETLATTAWGPGVQGIKRSADVLDEQAENILRDTRNTEDESSIVSLSEEATGQLEGDSGSSLESSVVGLMESEISYRASLGVIRSSNEHFDDMLDLLAPRTDPKP